MGRTAGVNASARFPPSIVSQEHMMWVDFQELTIYGGVVEDLKVQELRAGTQNLSEHA